MIPHSKPCVGQKEYSAVRKAIASCQLAQGNEVTLLEKELCSFVGHKYGLAVSSGTMALFGALKALEVTKGDKVIIPSYACTALANAVYMSGAEPVLCDVDYETALMSVKTVKAVLQKKTAAIIVPHLFGYPAPAHQIEQMLNIPVIEDCAQCIGAVIDGKNTGSLTSISIFSFYATKVICSGEGGLIATSDNKLANNLNNMREYDNRPTYEPRLNMKCTDIQAAIARVQLSRLPSFINKRRIIAEKYNSALDDSTVLTHITSDTATISQMYFRYVLRVNPAKQFAVIRYLKNKGISCGRPVFKPFHQYTKQNNFIVSEKLHHELLSVPIYPALTNSEIGTIADCLLAISNNKLKR
jgi:perosamine synthetase